MKQFFFGQALFGASPRVGMHGPFALRCHRERELDETPRARIKRAGLRASGSEVLIGAPDFGMSPRDPRRARGKIHTLRWRGAVLQAFVDGLVRLVLLGFGLAADPFVPFIFVVKDCFARARAGSVLRARPAFGRAAPP